MKSFFKKLLIVALACVLALSTFVGCSEPEDPNTGGNTPGTEQGGGNNSGDSSGGDTSGGDTSGGDSSGGDSSGGDSSETLENPDERYLEPQEYSLYSLAGTDAVGRTVKVADYNEDEKQVGIWYSVWQGQHSGFQTSINDVQAIIDAGKEDELLFTNDTGLSNSKQEHFYFWGQPLYGYYNMQDPFVITRHIELFTQAGLDFVCIDVTNENHYPDAVKAFLNILQKYHDQGFNVPKVTFYTNTKSGTMVDKLYNEYYQGKEWDDLWYRPDGNKPLIIGITEDNNNASDQTYYGQYDYVNGGHIPFTDYIPSGRKQYFNIKESQWPNGTPNLENGFPWMSWKYPQDIHNGYIAVPVAQHDYETTWFSQKAATSHRGYNNVTKQVEGDWKEGLSFQQMWDTCHQNRDEIDSVFMCCWNEGMAQKRWNPMAGKNTFIDVYNNEYSRDLELMRGGDKGYGDNYYMQMVKNVREFKFTEGVSYDLPTKTIDIDGDTAQFEDCIAKYQDFAGEAINRNFRNAANEEGAYVDNSARNDIQYINVIHDAEYVYFHITTVDDITEYNGTDENWMNIYVSIDSADKYAFHGYQYLINRSPNGDKTSVEFSLGGYDWESVGEADLRVNGNEMIVAVPIGLLELNRSNYTFEFKIADNVTDYKNEEDFMDYYVTGDTAPLGRLNYTYGY